MSASRLFHVFHVFRVRGSCHVRTRHEERTVVFVIELPRESCCCSQCGSEDVHSRGTTVRRLRCVPNGLKPAFVESAVPRLYCWSCHVLRQPDLGFADPKKRHIRVSPLCPRPLACHHAQGSCAAPQGLVGRCQGDPAAASGDALGKGHRYATVVLDPRPRGGRVRGQGRKGRRPRPLPEAAAGRPCQY